MARVLLVDDDPAVLGELGAALRLDGHDVLAVPDVGAGVELVARARPDVVVLEPLVAGTGAFDAITALGRAGSADEIPVVFLSRRSAEVDRVLAFELGAADHVAKPFSAREVALRVRALLRRGAPSSARPRGVVVGALRIDEDAHRAWVEAREIELTFLEWKLLLALFACRDRVVSRRTLLEDVWCDVTVTPRTIDTHVKRLREKLGPAGAYVQTVRGVGYRFCEGVEPADER